MKRRSAAAASSKSSRWLGGMLTNLKTMRTRIANLKPVAEDAGGRHVDLLPMKEVIKLQPEIATRKSTPAALRNEEAAGALSSWSTPRKEKNDCRGLRKLWPRPFDWHTNCDPTNRLCHPSTDDAIR